MNVLLVDDSKIFRNQLAKLLVNLNEDISVEEASTVDECVSILSTKSFQLLILDFQLKKENSLKILEFVRDSNITSVKIILTNHYDEKIKDICLKNGADHFIDKSGDFNMLISVLNSYLIK